MPIRITRIEVALSTFNYTIKRNGYGGKLLCKELKLLRLLSRNEIRTHITNFGGWKFYHLNYIGKPRLGRVLIKHRYPFIVLPTNYFLKNIDDIGQITKLRQEKNQESFDRNIAMAYSQPSIFGFRHATGLINFSIRR